MKKSYLWAATTLVIALGAGAAVNKSCNFSPIVVSADTLSQNSSAAMKDEAAMSSANSGLISAASSAAALEMPISSSTNTIIPNYIVPNSNTSEAVNAANSANISVYSSTASSAASFMNSEVSSLASLTSSYSSAKSSYDSAVSSAGSLIWSEAGVGVYGSYNSSYAASNIPFTGSIVPEGGSTSYYDFTVAAAPASLTALLGSEYISGTITANTNIINLTNATNKSGSSLFTVTNPTQDVTFTMNDVGLTNTGKQVNAQYDISFGDAPASTGGATFSLRGPFATNGTYAYFKMTISFVDAAGQPINGIFLGVNSDIDYQPLFLDAEGKQIVEGQGIYGLNDLQVLNPPDSDIVMQNANYGIYQGFSAQGVTNGNLQASIPYGSLGFTGWGSQLILVDNAEAEAISETGHAIDNQQVNWTPAFQRGGDSVAFREITTPNIPNANIVFISVEKPTLYEVVIENPNKPNQSNPMNPVVPIKPSSPSSPTSPTTINTISIGSKMEYNRLPETSDSPSIEVMMYLGFALVTATMLASLSLKNRKFIEESEKLAKIVLKHNNKF